MIRSIKKSPMRAVSKTVLVGLSVGVMTMGGLGMASAAPEAPSQPSAVQPDGGVVTPFADGSNRCASFTAVGPPAGYTAVGYVTNNNIGGCSGFYGHVQIIGPGININSATGFAPRVAGNGRGAGQVCAIAWQHNSNGTYTDRGHPCLNIF